MNDYPNTFGVFESMRSLNGKIVYFDAHLERLQKGCVDLKIKLPAAIGKLKNSILRGIEDSGFKDNYIRLSVWLEGGKSGYAVLVKQYKPYPESKYSKGFRAQVSIWHQDEGSPLAKIKVIDRSLHERSFQAAKSSGFDEAMILNSRGYVAECTRSNIFMVRGRELFTPSVECGCLNGVTRGVVFDLATKGRIKHFETKFTLRDIEDCDEAFLTNSLMGVMPLVSLGNIKIGTGSAGELTRWFIKKYNSLLK